MRMWPWRFLRRSNREPRGASSVTYTQTQTKWRLALKLGCVCLCLHMSENVSVSPSSWAAWGRSRTGGWGSGGWENAWRSPLGWNRPDRLSPTHPPSDTSPPLTARKTERDWEYQQIHYVNIHSNICGAELFILIAAPAPGKLFQQCKNTPSYQSFIKYKPVVFGYHARTFSCCYPKSFLLFSEVCSYECSSQHKLVVIQSFHFDLMSPVHDEVCVNEIWSLN